MCRALLTTSQRDVCRCDYHALHRAVSCIKETYMCRDLLRTNHKDVRRNNYHAHYITMASYMFNAPFQKSPTHIGLFYKRDCAI